MGTTLSTLGKRGLLLGALALLGGCPTTTTPTDAGTTGDTPAAPDAPIVEDAPPTADAPTADAGCACATGEICVRGVCLASCGADGAVLEGALAPSLQPVAHYCRSPVTWASVGDHVYEVATRMEGMVTHFDLVRWTAVPGTSAPTTAMLGTTSRTAADPGEMTFLGGYVAVSPDEAHAVFGFTTFPGTVGGIFDVATGSGAVVASDASGNFDAVFLDDTRCIVNGLALGADSGQGLYELLAGTMGGALVADGMGDSSGSIAYWAAEDLVVAGGSAFGTPFPTGETSRVFFVAPADLSTTSHADLSSGDFLSIPSAFTLIPGDALVATVYDASFAIDHLEARYLAVDTTGTPVASEPSALTTDGTFSAARTLDGDIGLQHAGGILVVRETD